MSMVVRTNTMAMSANSALNKNNSTVAGNLQKLSTGFRINRAADDASGLAVSEKMKAQIKALDQAGKNAQDGASLIKTAEGYMGEVHDMLNRIVELAEKSANGTYETVDGGAAKEDFNKAGTDRQAIQDEVNQLTAEIDRIAETANFNQLKLMDGTMTAKYSTDDVDGMKMLKTGDITPTDANKNGANLDTSGGAVTLYTRSGEAKTFAQSENATKLDQDYFTADQVFEDATAAGANAGQKLFDVGGTTEAPTYTASKKEGTIGGLKLQIGETSSASDSLRVSVMNFKTNVLFSALSSETVSVGDVGTGDDGVVSLTESNAKSANGVSENTDGLTLNVSNQDAAAKVAERVRTIINDVSSQRAKLGAMENRLDYTMNNLDTASQNITDANSRIRDTDMAKTMMQYTQGNTLTQAAQAMLAQANQAPSQVLQLLQ